MRCLDVIRELAAPTNGVSSTALDDHLAHCPRCAAWAERNGRLNRLWEATHPPAMSSQAQDRLWAEICRSLDQRPVSVSDSPRVSPWYRSRRAVLILAQAAVLLVGIAFLVRREPPRPKVVEPPPVAVVPPTIRFEIDQEQLVLLSLDGRGATVLRNDLALNDNTNAVDPFYAMYNTVEALASLQ